jgi:biotin operon repressor
MSKNATQSHILFQLMKAGDVVSKETISKTLGIVLMSVPVYIHELKKQFKAEVLSVRDGRKVIGYKLVSKNITVPQHRKNSILVEKPVKVAKPKTSVSEDGELPTLDKDAEITQIGEREFADIADSLGVSNGGHSFE